FSPAIPINEHQREHDPDEQSSNVLCLVPCEACVSKFSRLKEAAKECRCFIRDTDDLVCCLTIELEIKLGLGSTVLPVGKRFELPPPQAPSRDRNASDRNAYARRLPRGPAFLCDRFG